MLNDEVSALRESRGTECLTISRGSVQEIFGHRDRIAQPEVVQIAVLQDQTCLPQCTEHLRNRFGSHLLRAVGGSNGFEHEGLPRAIGTSLQSPGLWSESSKEPTMRVLHDDHVGTCLTSEESSHGHPVQLRGIRKSPVLEPQVRGQLLAKQGSLRGRQNRLEVPRRSTWVTKKVALHGQLLWISHRSSCLRGDGHEAHGL
mmetsp:Transcript_53039/g.141798  ORF Transcript_53039/g.141798 Transcript_53039/m.141798 type:complete len:201 (-) Transcript_53039:513-1115(-)